jgi:hypothetical protein
VNNAVSTFNRGRGVVFTFGRWYLQQWLQN